MVLWRGSMMPVILQVKKAEIRRSRAAGACRQLQLRGWERRAVLAAAVIFLLHVTLVLPLGSRVETLSSNSNVHRIAVSHQTMSDSIEDQAHVEGPQRRRLVLKPRDPEAAARLEAERAAKAGKVSTLRSALCPMPEAARQSKAGCREFD